MRAAMVVLSLAGCLPSFAAPPLRVLLLSGGEDPASPRAALWKRTLMEAGFQVRLNEETAGLGAAALASYDAAVVDTDTLPRADAQRTLRRYVESGKGLVVLRGLGCDVCDAQTSRRSQPAQAQAFTVRWTDRTHPVSAGLPESFLAVDRLRPDLKPAPGAHLLASLSGGTPLIWTLTCGKGRVFQTALGEDTALLQDPAFLNTLFRGIEWAATGKVTSPVLTEAHPARANPVRTLVVTGGHDHHAAFYDLFEGRPEIVANVDPHPMPYRRGDLRKRYDVLALYDSVQEMTDSERTVLRTFVESGKGLVLIHHALVDYCDWPWWYEEVVGGRWHRTADKPPRWITTWKHDVELLVYPVGRHPVTEGVGPLHIWDETYKGMWLSPGNTVLMKTDDPSSDGPVVWISPYRKSRVVVIELGHDRKAHLHPGYRRLVQNALLWAAGGDR